MRVYDLITKKKHGEKLTEKEISFLINGYVKGEIPDYQISALLMAIYFRGMDINETYYLTKAMIDSGDTINLSGINGKTVDKHSTGGVGDKTSLVLLPLMASCNLKVSKMSGRGLGHTGGTLDKLESIPGFVIDLSKEEMFEIVNSVGFAIAGQTANLVPADKKLYSLRDVTATVDNISLIASSIMSKKIASGADYILLDVKIGSGAFMKDLDHAIELSKIMVEIGNKFSKKVGVVLSNMDEPLGLAIGNSLEVIEAINTLENNGPSDFTELCIFLNAAMLKLTSEVSSIDEGINKTTKLIKSGKPFNKFIEFVNMQHGNTDYILDTDRFEKAKFKYDVFCETNGYISSIEAEKIGICSLMSGAGRETKEESIDYSAGIIICKKVGEKIAVGDKLGTIYTNKNNMEYELINLFNSAFGYSINKVDKQKVIIGLVDNAGFTDMRG